MHYYTIFLPHYFPAQFKSFMSFNRAKIGAEYCMADIGGAVPTAKQSAPASQGDESHKTVVSMGLT